MERSVYMCVSGAGAGREEGEEEEEEETGVSSLLAPGHSFRHCSRCHTGRGPPQVTSCHATAPKATAQL